MSKSDAAALQTAATAEEQPQITGPHVGLDKYGNVDHHYFRCESCGDEWVTSLDHDHECGEVF